MRARLAMLALVLSFWTVGCMKVGGRPDVSFSIGAREVRVDSTTAGYDVTTTHRIVAHGADSTAQYLVVLHFQRGVSLEAGEKPLDTNVTTVVRGGHGELKSEVYASKCGEYTRSDCLSHFVDPQDSVTIVGFVPVLTVQSAGR